MWSRFRGVLSGHERQYLIAVALIAVLPLAGCGDPIATAGSAPAGQTVRSTATVPLRPTATTIIVPTATPTRAEIEAIYPPLPNGTYLQPRLPETGLGSITITNGNDRDAIVKMVRGSVAVFVVLIRSRDAVVLPNVPVGSYDVWFCTGIGWDPERRRFVQGHRCLQFDDPTNFSETRDARGVEYVDFQVTLNSVAGGNASTDPLDADAFDTVK